MSSISAPQERFDQTYITSTEICKRLGITRMALVSAKRSGKLPPSISVNQQQVWERSVAEPYIAAWAESRGILAQAIK